LAILLVVIGGFSSDPALAQSQKKGDASIRLEFQHIRTGDFEDDLYVFDYWTTDTQVALLSGDYALSDRWTVFAALPYVRKRFNAGELYGGDPHNPNDAFWIDFVPPDKRFWDDGEYHNDFQDFSIGASYIALDGPLTVTPFISYGVPASDYPFFAKAAIGKNLWTLPVGVSLGYVPYFSDWHFGGNVAYVFSEKPLGVNVDYWLLHLSAGYWFKPKLSMNVFLSGKYTRGGFKMPWDFTDDPTYGNYPDEFDTEEWWHHDRLIGARHLNVGAGFDYFLNTKFKVSGSGYTGIWVEQTHEIDFAFTLGVTRYYGGEE
jgi:hypothetical protein